MYDRRALKRRHLIYHLRTFDQDSGELLGHLVDITPDGIMLVSESIIPLGKHFKLKMSLPTTILGHEVLEFEAKSKWNSRDVNPDFFDTGFALLDSPTEHMEVVEALVRDYGFND